MNIGDIADVNVGVVLNRKQAKYKSKSTTQYELFNLKIYEDRQNGIKIDYDKFISEEDLSSYLVKKNDLLLRLAFPFAEPRRYMSASSSTSLSSGFEAAASPRNALILPVKPASSSPKTLGRSQKRYNGSS